MKLIAFDVDGCLRTTAEGQPVANENIRMLLVILSQFASVNIRVWGGSGELYGRQVARELGVAPYVDSYSGKPDPLGVIPDIAFDDEDVGLGTVNQRAEKL
jgi:hypothetical protein